MESAPPSSPTSRFVHSVICKVLAGERGIHAETAVAAAARMAGTFLLRSLALPLSTLPVGTPVFSDAANDAGPLLVDRLLVAVAGLGLAFDPAALARVDATSALAQLSLCDTQRRFDPYFLAYLREQSLDYRRVAEACVQATAQLIVDCRDVLDPATALAIAISGIVEGAKTVPPAMQAPVAGPIAGVTGNAEPARKPWYQIW